MLSKYQFEQKYGKIECDNHNDKMAGLCSISTSPLCNPHCEKRHNLPKEAGCICSYCYSEIMNDRFARLRNKLIRNTELLTEQLIPVEDIPVLNSPTGFYRFEAFGDLINSIQVMNYFHFARYNPQTQFALWTKNPWIIKEAIEKHGLKKPDNLIIVLSSPIINKALDYNVMKQVYPFIDYTFTVYTKEYAAENNIKIVCGGNSCAMCGKCYLASHDQRNITELLK